MFFIYILYQRKPVDLIPVCLSLIIFSKRFFSTCMQHLIYSHLRDAIFVGEYNTWSWCIYISSNRSRSTIVSWNWKSKFILHLPEVSGILQTDKLTMTSAIFISRFCWCTWSILIVGFMWGSNLRSFWHMISKTSWVEGRRIRKFFALLKRLAVNLKKLVSIWSIVQLLCSLQSVPKASFVEDVGHLLKYYLFLLHWSL